MNTESIQSSLKEFGLEAWLLYDFHGSNPVARHVAGLGADSFATRRWFGLVPAKGEPIWLHHAIEAHLFADLPGRKIRFVGYHELRKKLGEILAGLKQVAMEYHPGGAIPYVSRVDAGTIEMVRDAGPQVVSSADLVQFIEARWTKEGLASHRRAAQGLKEVLHATYDEVARIVGAGQSIDEYTLQQFMGEQFKSRKLYYDPPIVAVNANAGNPHYEPPSKGSAPIRKGDLLLTDLWCREEAEGSIWADITWMSYLGATVPDRQREIWEIVAGARDAAVSFMKEGVAAGRPILGSEVDDVTRKFISTRGYGDYFLHRTGHSIGFEVHGNGCNVDGLETIDARQLIPRTGFSIEPGIYLPEFGVRSEIDVYMDEGSVEVTTIVQDAIVPLLP